MLLGKQSATGTFRTYHVRLTLHIHGSVLPESKMFLIPLFAWQDFFSPFSRELDEWYALQWQNCSAFSIAVHKI